MSHQANQNLVVAFFCALAIIQCTGTEFSTNSRNQIVISQRDSLLRLDSTVSLPPPLYYSGINFIIDTSSTVYFHNTEQTSTSTGEDLISAPIVGLSHEDLMPLSSNELGSFVDSIGENYYRPFKIVVIASTTDSVNMNALRILEEHLHKEDRYIKYLRLITDEEQEVLHQKLSNKLLPTQAPM